MAIPGERVYKMIRVRDASGAAVTGLVLGDFTIEAYTVAYGATTLATYTHSGAITEIGGGRYQFDFLLPPNAGYWNVRIYHATHTVFNQIWEDETENRDRDKLFGTLARPTATLSNTTQLGAEIALTLVARRYRQFTVTVTANGSAIDLSGYNNFRMCARLPNGTKAWESGPKGGNQVTGWDCTGDSDGVLTVTMPEDVATASAWQTATTYAVGDVVQGTNTGDPIMICTVAGTSGGTQPTWDTTPGNTTADNGIIWVTLQDFYALIDDAIAAGNPTTQLRWEITGDEDATASKTVPVIRSSPLTLVEDLVGALA